MDGSTLLAGRYRFLRWIPGGTNYFIWLARDEATGGVVVVSPLPMSRVLLLEPTTGVVHPRLAPIRQIIHDFDPELLPERRADGEKISAVVADRLAGKTLYDILPKGVLSPPDAISLVASICSPIAAMHRRGGAHGAISARCVVVERVDGGTSPALSQILVPPDGLYCSPERISGGGASALDDTWALFVTLYTALTGQRPFRGKTRIEITQAISSGLVAPLTDVGISDRDLQFLFDRGFASSLSNRIWRVDELRESLLAWLRRNAPEHARDDKSQSISRALIASEGDQRDLEVPDELQQAVVAARPSSAAIVPVPVVEIGAAVQRMPAELPRREVKSIVSKTLRPPIARVEAEHAMPVQPPPLEPATPAREDMSAGIANASTSTPVAVTDSSLVALSFKSEPPTVAEISINVPIPTASLDESPDAGVQRESNADLETASNLRRSVLPLPSYSPRSAKGNRWAWLWLMAGLFLVFVISGVLARIFLLGNDSTKASSSVSAKASAPRPAPIRSQVVEPKVASSGAPSAAAPIAVKPVESAAIVGADSSPAREAIAAPTGDLNACLEAFFPSDSFRVEVNLSFVCTENEGRKGLEKLRAKLVVGSGGQLTAATNEWPRLGWYQLGVYAIMRRSCCSGAEPIQLPIGPAACGAMSEMVGSFADAYRSGEGLSEAQGRFETAATCYQNSHVKGYSYPSGPFGGSQIIFANFLERNRKK